MKKLGLFFLVIILFLGPSSFVEAKKIQQKKSIQAKKRMEPIHFEGKIVQGTTNSHGVSGKAGQSLEITIKSPEDNAVFVVYKSDSNKTMPGAGVLDETKKWSTKLGNNADYKVVVGSIKGDSTYLLDIQIQ